ncbi:MAG TPA: hypothetical protein VK988_10715 [Acidimicrobiales bacterium]|nr:hypothetical protein [Actinomycetota bacterium]HSH60094.1 hypothetical protein [Acidimicrobiales bacterium]
MPRSLKAILEQADELADRFEKHEPRPDNIADATALRIVREAFQERVAAERRLADAVAIARTDGHSWALIGNMIGTSGEAARQRYKQPVTRH